MFMKFLEKNVIGIFVSVLFLLFFVAPVYQANAVSFVCVGKDDDAGCRSVSATDITQAKAQCRSSEMPVKGICYLNIASEGLNDRGCVNPEGGCIDFRASTQLQATQLCAGIDPVAEVINRSCPRSRVPTPDGQAITLGCIDDRTGRCMNRQYADYSSAVIACRGYDTLLPDLCVADDCASLGTCTGSEEYIYWTKEPAVSNECNCQSFRAESLAAANDYLERLVPQPVSCNDPNNNTTLPVTELFQLGTGTCPEVNSTAVNTYHCIVINSTEEGVKPGDCQVFQSTNNTDAYDQARTLCARDSTEAESVTALFGACPGSGSIDAGESAADLIKEASKTLNPAGIKTPNDFIRKGINLLMAFIGSITLVLYVLAGLLWMTASGNSEQADRAKRIMVWTTLGVAVMLFSYVLVNFLFNSIPK